MNILSQKRDRKNKLILLPKLYCSNLEQKKTKEQMLSKLSGLIL